MALVQESEISLVIQLFYRPGMWLGSGSRMKVVVKLRLVVYSC